MVEQPSGCARLRLMAILSSASRAFLALRRRPRPHSARLYFLYVYTRLVGLAHDNSANLKGQVMVKHARHGLTAVHATNHRTASQRPRAQPAIVSVTKASTASAARAR